MAAPGDSSSTPDTAPDAASADAGADTEPPQWLELDVTVLDEQAWSPLPEASDLAAAAATALAHHPEFADEPPSLACVALAADADVHCLNKQHRGFDKPTNVLSFPVSTETFADAVGSVSLLGDVIIAAETLHAEARQQNISPAHHLQHLVIHGLLHLLGFDHETNDEAEEMEGLETEILALLGIADPYARPLP